MGILEIRFPVCECTAAIRPNPFFAALSATLKSRSAPFAHGDATQRPKFVTAGTSATDATIRDIPCFKLISRRPGAAESGCTQGRMSRFLPIAREFLPQAVEFHATVSPQGSQKYGRPRHTAL